jgi:dCMP deaminase
MDRPSQDEYFLNIAKEVATRATCLRRKFGAVVVRDKRIMSTGYAGAPSGTPNCCDLGKCYRQERKIPSGQNYELCRSVHAEMNAIIQAGYERTKGATIYVAGIDLENGNKEIEAIPCKLCKRVIINAGIEEVVTRKDQEIIRYKVSDWVEESKRNPFADLEAKI